MASNPAHPPGGAGDAQQLEECVLRLGRVMSKAADHHALLLSIIEECKALLDSEAASVALYDPDANNLNFVASAGGAGEGLSEWRIALGQGIVGKVAESREPIISNDCRSDPRWFSKVDDGTGFVTRNLAAMPMLHGDELIGVLEVLNRRNDAPFTDADVRLLQIFADQVGVAIRLQKLIREKQNSERLAGFGVALADIGHSVKNILMRLKGPLGLIDRGIANQEWEMLNETWPVLKRATHQINDLVLEMLDYSKPSKPEFTKLSLRDLFVGILANCQRDAANRGIELSMTLPEPAPEWPLDEGILQPALMNLVSNGIEAISEHQVEGAAIDLSARVDGGILLLLVADTGPGIPEDIQEKIFKPFFTTRKKAGTGLGLANVVKAVEAHGGKVKLDSELGRGTTFVLSFPRN